MSRVMPLLAAALITTLCGVAHGLKSDRWSVSRELRDSSARVERVPAGFGDWVGTDSEIDRRSLEMAAITGYVSRRYVNRRTGSSFGVLLVCGRPGPISVHTPDICYAGAGYVIAGTPARFALTYGDPPHPAELFWADFDKPAAATASRMRVFWSWSTGGPWKAPENPRLTHAAHRALYKLYVTRELPGAGSPAAEDEAAEFLKELFPVLDQTLTPAAAGGITPRATAPAAKPSA